MYVAIIKNGIGVVKVEEFRISSDISGALNSFINDYDPPLNVNDYTGFDTGWQSFTKPSLPNHVWGYNFSTQALVETTPETLTYGHIEEEYDGKKRLVRKTVYRTTDGSGTFSNKTEETTYNWEGNNLKTAVYKTYNISGQEKTSELITYTTEITNGNTIIKQQRK